MECCVGVSTETVLQIDKFYTVMKIVYELKFRTVVTKNTKLIEFQFKLLHKRLSTNSYLYKIKTKNTESCTFCKTQKEDIIHLFWYCDRVASLWNRIEIMIKQQNIVIAVNF